MATEPSRGLVDTSVIVDLEHLPAAALPQELIVSAISLAELAASPHAARTTTERANRQERLQRTEAAFDPLPFDASAARAYARVYASVAHKGGKARGRRALDLLIASTALAHDLPLYTRNSDDFTDLADLVEIHAI